MTLFPKYATLTIVLLLLSLSVGLWISDVRNRQANLQTQTQLITEHFGISIEEKISTELELGIIFRNIWIDTINFSQLYSQERFENLSANFYDNNENVVGVNWINTTGTIKWIFPNNPTSIIINQSIVNYADGRENLGFAEANVTGNIGFSNIALLYQGGKGFSIYIPLIYQNLTTGFLNIVYKIDQIFDSIVNQNVIFQDYSFQVFENLTEIYQKNENFEITNNFIEKFDIHFQNRVWRLYISPNQQSINEVSYFANLNVLSIGLFSTIIAGILTHLLNKQAKIIELNYLEKENIEKTLFQSQKMESLGFLAGGIAHDVNNILMGIMGNTSLFNLQPELTPEQLQENQDNVNDIIELIHRGADLINQILEFSRKSDYQTEIIDIRKIAHSSIKIFSKTIDKRIKIITSFSEEALYIKANPTRIHQIFMNLLINARDAMHEGGEIKFQLEKKPNTLEKNENKIPDQDTNQEIRIVIQDSGSGISQEIIEHIFDPFFTTKEIGKGTGLGLSIVYRTISSMNGKIEVKTKLNEGTAFIIHLPIYNYHNRNIIQDISYGKSSYENCEDFEDFEYENQALRILLVEDEIQIGKSLKNYLSQHKHLVDYYSEGLKALEVFTSNSNCYDMIILDINLPDINGGEIYQKIKNIAPNQRILFITGYFATQLPLMDDMDLGVLQKPFDFQKMDEKLRIVLGEKIKH